MRWAAITVLAWLASSGVALAGAAPRPDPGPAPIPVLEVTGEASVEGLRIEVRCEGGGLLEVEAICRVRARFVVRAGVSGEVAISSRVAPNPFGDPWRNADGEPLDPGELRADGEPLPAPRLLAPGAAATIEIDARRRFQTHREIRDAPYITQPMLTRHFVLGETAAIHHVASQLSASIVAGDRITLTDPIAIDARQPGPTTVRLGTVEVHGEASVPAERPDLVCALEVPRDHESVLAHGGPLLALGDRVDLATQAERFLLRVGYELGVAEYLFASLELETDFDSLMEALVVEIASPSLLFFVPSFSAGIGVVARQLGPRDADAALRLRLGAVYGFVGLGGDLDYWPAIGEWTATLFGRLSM